MQNCLKVHIFSGIKGKKCFEIFSRIELLYLFWPKMIIDGIFSSLSDFQRFKKKVIFYDFLKNYEGNFFEKRLPEIDVERQFYTIKRNI